MAEGTPEMDTGGTVHSTKIVDVAFDRFTIKVRLTADGKFMEIVGVAVSKDFRSEQQKRASRGYHDVSDLYEQ